MNHNILPINNGVVLKGTEVNNNKCSKPELLKNEYHLWYTSPQECQDPDLLEQYRQLLTEKETEKQQRYIFEKDRRDALVTRVFVRDLLSQYMDTPAEDWRFSKGDKGKPEIINPSIPLRFNLSHTKGLIICAVTLNHDIGCDVEHIERKSDVLAIANRFFSKVEVNELFSLSVSEQRDRFFDYWTLKESYIKSLGQGLAIPLSEFSYHIGRKQSPWLNKNIHLSFESSRNDEPELWQSWLFYPGDQHRISVSIRNRFAQQKDAIKWPSYKARFFESVPLVGYSEVDRISTSAVL